MDRADNRSGSTTSGAADRAAGGQSGAAGAGSANTPQTGMADRDRGGDTQATAGQSGSASGNQSGNSGNMRGDRGGMSREWETGANGTSGWDNSCFISPTTTSFMLLTRDGRQVRLDDASNQMIQQRISSTNRVSQKSKIFRVRVNGDMTGDSLHVTDIQM